jgi:hypothetical protein
MNSWGPHWEASFDWNCHGEVPWSLPLPGIVFTRQVLKADIAKAQTDAEVLAKAGVKTHARWRQGVGSSLPKSYFFLGWGST